MRCPKCQNESPAGSAFCHHCGRDFPAGLLTDAPAATPARTGTRPLSGTKCPSCGATNPDDAPFCSLCGADFRTARASITPAEPEAAEPPAGGESAPEEETKERPESDALQRKRLEGLASPAELVRLAELKLRLGHREDAARFLFESLQADPRDARARHAYLHQFTEDELREWGLGKTPTPLWAEPGQTLAYPLARGGAASLAITAAFFTIGQNLPFFGLVFAILGSLYTATLYGKHLKWAAMGRFGYPQFIDLDASYFWYGFFSGFSAFFPLLAAGILSRLLPDTVAAVLLWAGLLYIPLGLFLWPMAFLAATLFNDKWIVFRYGFILRSTGRVFLEYIASLALLVGAAIGIGIFRAFLPVPESFVIRLPIVILVDFTALYLGVLQAHTLGRLYYNNQKRLGWF